MKHQRQNDLIWKALADATRREILDALAERPQTSGDIVARFDGLCRTNVMKHLDILVAANLVIVRREGRSRWNYLNPVPIQRVCDRWVSKHVKHLAAAMSRLKDHVEERKTQTSQQSVSKKPNRTKK
jgi:DNA-binding transcriptional ArsR family regulator